MTFVFEWGDYAIPETSIDVDATSALPLWPEDADLPEGSDHSSRAAMRHYTSSEFRKVDP